MTIEIKRTKVKMNKPIYLSLSILAKHLCISFGMSASNRNDKIKQNYVTQILIALLFILELKLFTKTLLMMLKNGLHI